MLGGGHSVHLRPLLVSPPPQWHKSARPVALPPDGGRGVSVYVLSFSVIQHQCKICTSILFDAVHLFIASFKSEICDSSFRFWSLISSFSWEVTLYLAWKIKTKNYSKQTYRETDIGENSAVGQRQSTVRSLTSSDKWAIVSSFWFRSERRSLVWLIRSKTTSCHPNAKD